MTIIPLHVPCEPTEWLLLDLQGDISLRRIGQPNGGSNSRQQSLNPVDKPALNAIDTYANLELGVIQLRVSNSSRTPCCCSASAVVADCPSACRLCCADQDGRHLLRIGNHLLDCQLTALKKPLLVCKRSRHMTPHSEQMETEQAAEGEQEGGGSSSSSIHCVAVVRHKVSVLTRPVPIIVATPGPMPAIH